jgi:hypothetical protein
MPMPAVLLHLNLHREFFDAIARKQKRIEYRKQSPYWRKGASNNDVFARDCAPMRFASDFQR